MDTRPLAKVWLFRSLFQKQIHKHSVLLLELKACK